MAIFKDNAIMSVFIIIDLKEAQFDDYNAMTWDQNTGLTSL
jgi:hypothetical protein